MTQYLSRGAALMARARQRIDAANARVAVLEASADRHLKAAKERVAEVRAAKRAWVVDVFPAYDPTLDIKGSKVMCQRCNSTARAQGGHFGRYVCPRCGPLVHSMEPYGVETGVTDHGFHPERVPQETGYYIDNQHPCAGYREPAWLWIEGRRG